MSADKPLTSPSISHPKKIYYGYVIVLACFVMMVFGWGLYYNYGVFFGPLEQTFGWPRALTSGALSVSLIIAGLLGIIAGRLSDRYGLRIVVIICTLFLSAGYILLSFIQSAWQFYAVYGIIIAVGISGFWAPQVATVARWFQGRRGLMTGIVSGGSSFGTLAAPPILTQLITAYSWRNTYLILGIAILVINLVMVQFIRFKPVSVENRATENSGSRPETPEGYSLEQAIKTRQFWMVATIYFGFGLAQLTLMVHIVPYASGKEISAIQAAGILSIIGGVSLASRIIMGALADRLRPQTSLVICALSMTIAISLLFFSNSLWNLYFFAVLLGFGYGGLSCLQSLITADLYGLTSLGVITAVFSFSFNLGGAAGPVVAGRLFDMNHSYFWAFLICFLMMAAVLIMGIALKPLKNRRDK